MLPLTSPANVRCRHRLRDAFGPRGGRLHRRRHRGRGGDARLRARRHRPATPRHGRGAAAVLGAPGSRGLARGALGRRPRGDRSGRGRSRDRRRHRHRLHRIHPAPGRCATGRRCASSTASPAGRTRTRSCGSTTRRSSRPSASRRSRPSAASRGSRATAAGSPPSGSSPRRSRFSRRTSRSTRAAERWIEAADWIVWQLCGVETRSVGAAGYKAQFQEGRYPNEAYLQRPEPAVRRLRPRQARTAAVAARSARRRPHARRRPPPRPAGRGSRSSVGNVDAHVTAPAARSIEPGHMLAVMGTSTCHVMNGEVLAEVPGMCGVVDGGITPGLLGYEAGQSGVGDIFAWFVDQQLPGELPRRGRAARSRRARVPLGARGRPGARRARARRARLAQREPLRPRRPRAAAAPSSGSTLRTRARGRLPRADRGDRVRRSHDRRDLRGVGPPGARVHGRRRSGQEHAADADLLGRASASAARRRLGRGTGARRGDPRRRRRGLPRRRPRRVGGDGKGAPQPVPARRRPRRIATTSCTATTPRCTTISAGAAR